VAVNVAAAVELTRNGKRHDGYGLPRLTQGQSDSQPRSPVQRVNLPLPNYRHPSDGPRYPERSKPKTRRSFCCKIAAAVNTDLTCRVCKTVIGCRQIVGSRAAAIETVLVLRQVLSKARFSNIEQLVEIIRSVGRKLVDAQPKGASPRSRQSSCNVFAEHTVGNTVRRVLHHIREEYKSFASDNPTQTTRFSISKFVLLGQPRQQSEPAARTGGPHQAALLQTPNPEDDPDDPDYFAKNIKPVVMEALQDVFDELDTVYDNVSKSARDHIHSE
jgi:hypothetical protein